MPEIRELSDEDLEKECDHLRDAHWETWVEYRRNMTAGFWRILPESQAREVLRQLDEVRDLRRRWQEAEKELKRRGIKKSSWWWPF